MRIPDSIAQIQTMMMDGMRKWIDSTGSHRNEIIGRLTSDAVRGHRNKRLGDHSQSSGHVHNDMLPEGGLQGALAAHKISVVGPCFSAVMMGVETEKLITQPGAGILNAGQDLMSGKMVSTAL